MRDGVRQAQDATLGLCLITNVELLQRAGRPGNRCRNNGSRSWGGPTWCAEHGAVRQHAHKNSVFNGESAGHAAILMPVPAVMVGQS
eukprot:358404-Chlamydomonas_euryale.AAC.11